MDLISKIGLYPLKLLKNAFNPKALMSAFARPANSTVFIRMPDGSFVRPAELADAFGIGQYIPPSTVGNTFMDGVAQRITQPRWSELLYTDNSTTILNPFSTLQTGISGNSEQAGAFPAYKNFVLRAIRQFVKVAVGVGTTATVAAMVPANDISLLMFNGTFELVVQSKSYLRVPLYMLPSGIGLPSAVAATGTYTPTAREVYTISGWGVADPRAVFSMPDVLEFKQLTNFIVNLAWATAVDLTGNQTISTIFDGHEDRTVQ